ncbi:MAG: hypothetical protein RR052_00900 [Oscillospiraceae bacterium]
MDLKKLFPLSFRAIDSKNLLISVLIYIVVPAVIKFVFSLLTWIPILGMILNIISWIIGLYCVVGIVLAILAYAKVMK